MLVSHDPQDTLSWADKILVMKDGKIVQQGKPEMIYKQPVNEYVGGLFGEYNLIPPGRFKPFSKLPEFKRNIPLAEKKSMFIRPENFKLVKKKNKALRGKVQKVIFLGNYCEIEVYISKNVITVKAEGVNIKKGDTVYISLVPDSLWYV